MSIIDDFNYLTRDLTVAQAEEKLKEYRVNHPSIAKYWEAHLKERDAHNSETPQSERP